MLRLLLIGVGVKIDTEVERPVIERLAAEAGIAPARVVAGTFLVNTGILEIMIAAATNAM
jgi:hypothetical protein